MAAAQEQEYESLIEENHALRQQISAHANPASAFFEKSSKSSEKAPNSSQNEILSAKRPDAAQARSSRPSEAQRAQHAAAVMGSALLQAGVFASMATNGNGYEKTTRSLSGLYGRRPPPKKN